MQATTNLLEYIKRQKNFVDINKLLKDNSLFYNIGNLVCEFVDEDYKAIDDNRKIALMYEYEIVKLCRLFSNKNIHPIIFKGLFLSRILYGNIFERMCNDLDIYIQEHQFDQALKLLLNNGYQLRSEVELKRQHHVVLIKEKSIVLELHKKIFHPMIGINEDLLKNETCNWEFGKKALSSFSITGTFLHLLYHLYMDSYLTYNSLYTLFLKKKFQEVNRFLYRAYEISLFSEKYFNEIKWKDIERDVKSQKLRIIFKKMILDIIEIFPNAFPESFLRTVFHLEYIDDERDQLYKYLIDSEIKKCYKDIDYILSNYINDKWETRREKNICKKVGETISLTKETSEEKQDLNCVIDTEKTADGLKLVFKVSNDDFCISEIDNYDTQTSDGVHLLLCGTEQYSYNSIFFFPKQIGGEIRVVVCDVLNNRNQILTDDLIKAEFSKTENEYTITATLSNKFLKENNLNSYLYMGLVISDCSSETLRRKNQLILSEEDSQWYNPTYFAKIDME